MLAQIIALSRMNFKSVLQRKEDVLITAFSISCIVGVLIGMLSIAEGYKEFVDVSHRQGLVLVLREGADAEVNSPMNYDEVAFVTNSEYVKKGADGEPLASPEFLWTGIVVNSATKDEVMVGLRGVTDKAVSVRPHYRIVQGRNITEGLNELVVGKSLFGKYDDLKLNGSIKIMGVEWRVVGVFEDAGSSAESEMWVDLPVLQGILPWGKAVHSVRVQLDDVNDLQKYNDELSANKQVLSRAGLESDYYKKFSEKISDSVSKFTYPVILLMSIGAVVGIVMAVFNSIDEKRKQIATLKVLGFRNSAIFGSLIIESAVVALLGALVGALFVFLAFDGYSASTSSGDALSVQFRLSVNQLIVTQAVVFSLAIGVLAALAPATYAIRMPLSKSLN